MDVGLIVFLLVFYIWWYREIHKSWLRVQSQDKKGFAPIFRPRYHCRLRWLFMIELCGETKLRLRALKERSKRFFTLEVKLFPNIEQKYQHQSKIPIVISVSDFSPQNPYTHPTKPLKPPQNPKSGSRRRTFEHFCLFNLQGQTHPYKHTIETKNLNLTFSTL